MILYVNGDSHTAAAEAVNPHAWACDDSRYFYLGKSAHPDNLSASWGKNLADTLKMGFFCQAQAGGSNDRIIRTTREFFDDPNHNPKNYLVIIQWSTWEREEWLIDGEYYQVNASGIDQVPEDHQQRYKDFVATVDWKVCTAQWHEKIWNFHLELESMGIPHVFFNGDNDFTAIDPKNRKDWKNNYIGPYDSNLTFSGWLDCQNHQTVSPNSRHFGKDAHAAWARFMLQYVIKTNLVT